MGINTEKELKELFRRVGVSTVYVKTLAPKQDNEKNQVVLAGELNGLLNAFPVRRISLRAASESEKKRNSAAGRPISEAELDYYWLDRLGNSFSAPGTRLIEYFQYPEVRMSGFLVRCKWAPDAIRRDKQARFGKRILVLGGNRSGQIYGLLLNEKEDPLVSSFPATTPSGISGVLGILYFGESVTGSPTEILIRELREIVMGGWHRSVRNKGGRIIPFSGNQGGGYTLEALLGVETNALKEPDAYGHEIKSYRGDKLSLMTPTADLGVEGKTSFREFMDIWGKPGKKNDGSVRFTGVHRVGQVNSSSGAELRVAGYDAETGRFDTVPENIRVEIIHPDSQYVVSGWSLEKLANSWNTKHGAAAYIRTERGEDHVTGEDCYRYIDPWFMCEGTDVWRLIRAIAEGLVYYDPAHTIYADGRAWVRPQWRIGTRRLGKTLQQLYAKVSEVS